MAERFGLALGWAVAEGLGVKAADREPSVLRPSAWPVMAAPRLCSSLWARHGATGKCGAPHGRAAALCARLLLAHRVVCSSWVSGLPGGAVPAVCVHQYHPS